MHHSTTTRALHGCDHDRESFAKLALGALVHQLSASALATESLGRSGDLSKVGSAGQGSSCTLPLVLGGRKASSKAGTTMLSAYVLVCQRTHMAQPRHSAQTTDASAEARTSLVTLGPR